MNWVGVKFDAYPFSGQLIYYLIGPFWLSAMYKDYISVNF